MMGSSNGSTSRIQRTRQVIILTHQKLTSAITARVGGGAEKRGEVLEGLKVSKRVSIELNHEMLQSPLFVCMNNQSYESRLAPTSLPRASSSSLSSGTLSAGRGGRAWL